MMNDKQLEKLLDRPIRDLLSYYADEIDEDENLTMGEVWLLFGTIHPASAGDLIKDINEGINREGFTAQGTDHPDYQRKIEQILDE